MRRRANSLVAGLWAGLLFMACSREAPPIVTPEPPPPEATYVIMNEIYSRGTASDPDWVEVYNPFNSAVDLTGYHIYDSGGKAGTKPKKGFPAGVVVPSHGFYVIVTDNTGDPSDFGLSSGGEEIWLEDSTGVVVDYVTFPAMDVTQSYSRIPDGAATWQLAPLTRGGPNHP